MARRPSPAALLLACLLAGCVAPGGLPAAGPDPVRKGPRPAAGGAATPAPAGTPGGATSAARPRMLAGRVVAGAGAVIANAGVTFLSDQGGGVIANHGGALINDGGPMLLRAARGLLALPTSGVAAARVALVTAAGATLAEATTDAQGGFALAAPGGAEAAFVRAEFEAHGEAFTYMAPAEPGEGEAGMVVDEASTLVSELAQATGAARPAGGPLGPLVGAVRAALGEAVTPFMARRSADRLAGLEQLLLDRPALAAQAAAIAPALARPTAPWQVGTIGGERQAGSGPLGRSLRAIVARPDQGVDVAFATPAGLEVAKAMAGGPVTTIAKVPGATRRVARLARLADGRLLVAAVPEGENVLRVWVQDAAGAFVRQPGTLMPIAEGGERDLGQIAVDPAGAVYVADTDAHVVRRLDPGAATTVVACGAEGQAGHADGARATSRLNAPEGVALAPDGAVIVADTGNACLRRLAPDGAVSTLVGKPGEAAYVNGRGAAARLGAPESLAIGPQGDIYVADRESRRVRRLSRDGSVFLVAGTGAPGNVDGPGHEAAFLRPTQLTLASRGRLFVRDVQAGPPSAQPTFLLRTITPPGPSPGGDDGTR